MELAMRKEGTRLARSLRRRQTEAECKLWSRLRNRQVDGWKFKRQEPFGPYVLDFYCFEAGLAVEIDGGTHSEPEELARDAVRSAFLNENGVRVLRVWNGDVHDNIDGVIEAVYQVLGRRPAPAPGARRRTLSEGRGKSEQASGDEQANAQRTHH